MAQRDSERQRVPAPLIRHRIASGRGAMEQPNARNDEVPLTPRFWLALLLVGIATGLIGDALIWILREVTHHAFNFHSGTLLAAVRRISDLRRVVVVTMGGVIGGVGWYFVRRWFRDERSEIDDVLWTGGELGWRRSTATAVLSEVVVGMGASVGREAAPKLMGGVCATLASKWFGLTASQQRLLVACAGGAGLAAVYNVPLGGAVFAAEVLYGSFSLPVVLPALACSLIATAVGWIYLANGATYGDIPSYQFSGTLMAFSLVGGLVIGVLAVLHVRIIGWVSHHRIRGPWLMVAMPVAFAIVGSLAIFYPALLGNGKDMAHEAFLGTTGLSLLIALACLKPLATSLSLGSGAAGGVFTPFLAIGAVSGGALGVLWTHLWPGSPSGAFAIVGAAAMIGAAMQAPLAGLVLVLELTHIGFSIVIPMMTATIIATWLVRQVDGYSIYSARLPQRLPDRKD